MEHKTHYCCHECGMTEHETQDDVKAKKSVSEEPIFADKKLFSSALISVAFIAWLVGSGGFQAPVASDATVEKIAQGSEQQVRQSASALEAAVFPTRGIRTIAVWGDVVPQLVEQGVIDRDRFVQNFSGDSALTQGELAILDTPQLNTPIAFRTENSRFTVDVLWAIGLAQKSDVLDKGPMRTSGTPTEQFASTGGWSLGSAQSNVMDYYSKWNLLGLNTGDQERVTRIAETVYRPCCGNSTAFPDCNHGMAMLGLIELMVSQDATDDEIYAAAKAANTYWFPDSTLEMATYFMKVKNTAWENVDATTVVSQEYASGQGARNVTTQLQSAGLLPPPPKGGGSCGA